MPGQPGAVKRSFKALRDTQPFNWVSTTAAKLAFGAAGGAPDVVVDHLHRVGTVRCRLPNGRTLRLWSRGDDWVSNRVYWRGMAGYEPESTAVFFRLATGAAVTLDVGGYVG